MASMASSILLLALVQLLVVKALAQGCTFQAGFNFPGNDLSTVPSLDSRDECCLECRKTAGCSAFTFFVSGVNANKCVLKKAINNPVADPTATSGVATGTCTFESGYEYPLFNISTFPNVPNKESCCYWCTATIKCVAFSYFTTGDRAKNCDLKFATNNRVSTPNMVSATSAVGTTTCTYDQGYSYRGFDLKTVTAVTSKEACCAKCKAEPKCTAFAYTLSGPAANTCVLKSTSLNKAINTNAISGTASCNPCGTTA